MLLRSHLVCLLALLFLSAAARAQTPGFTYQGRLTDGSIAASGTYQMQFTLFGSSGGNDQIGPVITNSAVSITSGGIFTVQLDFSPSTPFAPGADRWLEIAVKGASGTVFTILTPRQQISSSPFSIRTVSSNASDSLSSACMLCVTDAHISSIDGAKVTGTVANAMSASTAGNVTGVVQIANGGTGSTTKNFVDLSTNQPNIVGNKTFSGAVGVTGGSGVFNGNGSGLTNLNGASITNNTVNASALASDTFPNNRNLSLLGQRRWDLLGQRVAVGLVPREIAFDGANIWVTNSNSNNVTKLRAGDGANLGIFPVGVAPYGVAFDGANIWVTNSNSNNVTKLRAVDGANLGTFPVGLSPHGVAFDGASIWVANYSSNNVMKLRAGDGVLQGTFPVGNSPWGVAFDGANIWVVNQSSNNVTKLRAVDGVNLGTFPVDSSPHGVAFDGANIWVANLGGGNVTKLRAVDGACVGTCTFPGASPIAVAFDGTNIWVANFSNSNVTKLRATDGALQGTFGAGTNPWGVAFDGANMWVSNSTSNDVTRLPVFP